MKLSKGFTFVEILIVLGVFSVLITAVLGIFAYSIRIQKYTLASQQLLDQTSYVMEYMGRMVRMAKKCTDTLDGINNPSSCISTDGDSYSPSSSLSSSSIQFIKAEVYEETKTKKCMSFSFSDGKIFQSINKGSSLQLTSNDIEVTSLKFHISGGSQPPTDNFQPRITIFLSARVKNMNPAPVVNLQTTISQRDLDVEEE